MINVSLKLAKKLPFSLLKAIGSTVLLDQPKGLALYASGKGVPSLIKWQPGWMYELLTYIKPVSQGLFIDVGANIGQTMLAYMLADGDSYLGIEANPICAGFVDEIISQNQLSGYRVLAAGLSDRRGFSVLYISYATDAGATMVTNMRNVTGRHEQIVPIYTLDEVVDELDLPGIGTIKIDVESHELEVIRGMHAVLANQRPIVLCEVLGTARGKDLEIKHARNNALHSILKDHDYQAFNVIKSPDARSIDKLNVINSFPDIHWSEDLKETFDYVFIPAGKISALSNIIA